MLFKSFVCIKRFEVGEGKKFNRPRGGKRNLETKSGQKSWRKRRNVGGQKEEEASRPWNNGSGACIIFPKTEESLVNSWRRRLCTGGEDQAHPTRGWEEELTSEKTAGRIVRLRGAVHATCSPLHRFRGGEKSPASTIV